MENLWKRVKKDYNSREDYQQKIVPCFTSYSAYDRPTY